MEERYSWEKRRAWSAYFLLLGYISTLIFEFLLLEPVLMGNGNWVFLEREQLTSWGNGFSFFAILFSIFPVLFFILGYLKARSRLQGRADTVAGWQDMVYYFAWYQAGYGILMVLYFLVPAPLFQSGTVAGIIEGAVFHVWMVILFFALFSSRKKMLGLQAPTSWWRASLAVVGLFIAMLYGLDPLVTSPVSEWLNLELDSWRENQIAGEIVKARENGILAVTVQFIMIGMIVPFAEEIMFRGVFQSVMVQRFGAVIGILASSLFFAMIHVDPALMAPLLTLGLILGWLRHAFNSLWIPVLFHALNNMLTYLHYYFL